MTLRLLKLFDMAFVNNLSLVKENVRDILSISTHQGMIKTTITLLITINSLSV